MRAPAVRRFMPEVAGYGSTCEAFHRVRLQECDEEPARAIELAMRDASIGSDEVDYVNLHGTSTELNDRIETHALKPALGKRGYRIPMSALKSQIGHPQGGVVRQESRRHWLPCTTGRSGRPSTSTDAIPSVTLTTCPILGATLRSSKRSATALRLALRILPWCCGAFGQVVISVSESGSDSDNKEEHPCS